MAANVKMVTVKAVATVHTGPRTAFAPGSVFDLPSSLATSLAEQGSVVLVDPPPASLDPPPAGVT